MRIKAYFRKMRALFILSFLGFLMQACHSQTKNQNNFSKKPTIGLDKSLYHCQITNNEFFASYKGADFIGGEDIGHQLSNFVADSLGKYLKSEYQKGAYKKVDFKETVIQTLKYHPDSVYYTIKMPLKNVSACDAYTCIDHRGSWISLVRKTDSDLKEFISKISIEPNHKEEVQLFTTEFGLYEYWVQFRHPILQKNCK